MKLGMRLAVGEKGGCAINIHQKDEEFKKTEKSHFINCTFKLKDGEEDALFNLCEGESFIVKLDGYAIIPVEEYNNLIKPSFFKKSIKYIKRVFKKQ